jgi:cob(I)alamin adenosyltransferase
MKIYTKAGDGGETRLYGGKKVRKDHARVRAYGDVDELNAAIGWAKSHVDDASVAEKLEQLQQELFILGSDLATPPGSKTPAPAPRIGPEHAERLEQEIDRMQTSLPALTAFILPGGSPAGAALHLARTMARRAERTMVPLFKKQEVSLSVQIYLNRVSDYLFVLARFVNRHGGIPETQWNPK